MLRTGAVIGVVALACLGASAANAATASASISVSATVVGSCTVTGTGVAFGAYTPQTAAGQEGALTVNCSSGTAYVVSLDGGSGGGRRMVGPNGATLPYEIYRDGSRTQRWGDGAAGETGTGSGAAQTLRLYAAIPATAVDPGSYADTVTATLTY